MKKEASIFVAGHKGMVGSAIVRKLQEQGYDNLIMIPRASLDLTDQRATADFFSECRPRYVFLAAAKVGGIHANNTQRAEFIYENLIVQCNVIHEAYRTGVKKLLFLGSSCIYPKFADQPIQEESLLTGQLEPTNEPYAIAKIAGIKMCEAYRNQYGCNFISLMPTNLYGPNDNYDLQNSHVLPALVRKFVEAVKNQKNKVLLWGSGKPKREFMHVDDMADAAVYTMNHYDQEQFLNVGSGHEISIYDLARIIARITGFKGKIEHDLSKPDGTPRKIMDSSKLRNMGWTPKIDLESGLKSLIQEVMSDPPWQTQNKYH